MLWRAFQSIVLCISFIFGVAVVSPASAGVSPDGNIVFFTTTSPGYWSIYIMPASGGSPTLVPVPLPMVHEPTWSPNGRDIVFQGGPVVGGFSDGIYTVRSDGTGFRQVIGGVGDTVNPDFSPDGQQVVFSTVYGTIHIVNFDGTGHVNLGVPGGMARWQPGGRLIAFSNWGFTYNSDIFTLDLDSMTVNQVTTRAGDEAWLAPSWSPDGQRLAAMKLNRSPVEQSDTWVMNIDGSEAINLTNTLGYNEGSAWWSPDGQYIVVGKAPVDGSGLVEVWRMRADGSQKTQIPALPGFNAFSPRWGSRPFCFGDADNNGYVEFLDITHILANFNQTCP